ncbi:putative T7SS-secreted protein [Streptomyces sp. NPDC059256]|uniref:putative T7SS-secreted protein n=1 Tax=Streptomyces sp. NPDC059256 TaxID=3346794 RepID=UPI0036C2FBF3
MGIGDLVSDLTPDVVEDAVEDATEWAGDRVEDAGDWTADRLKDVGWDSGADWVREKSRSLANRMGAEVDELDLGQTDDKTKLIYGSPSKLRSTAAHLKDFQKSFTTVAQGLKGLDSSSVKGEAAEAFRETVAIEPPKWLKGADAYGDAAGALEAFASTVEWAQGQAQTAIEKWKAGTKASEDAWDAHKAKHETFNRAAEAYNAMAPDQRDPSSLPPRPGEFKDPGTALMKEAQELLGEARKQRNSAAETARTAVRAARDAAPPKPSYHEQAVSGLNEMEVIQSHFVGGVIKGTAGLVNFVRSVNPLDPYNLTHPAEYALALNNTAAGLVQVANDPWGAGKQMVTGFMKDPAEGIGRLVPDLLLTAATGGGGAAVKGARVAKEAADLAADASRARKAVDDAPEGTHNRQDGQRTTTNTDPVDLASGRMFLPQTDVMLPGALPLLFTRRVESGYRAGRFFGPSWSSTVDERLEVDAAGVIHVTADGLLLTYPHPVPGLPTLPESGISRCTLARDEAGDYTITDPDSGLTRHFTAPPGGEPGDDGDAWLVQISDRNQNTITFDRTPDGVPLALVHSAGHRLALSLDEDRVTSLALDAPDGPHPVMSYGYDDGNLTTVTKPSGATLTFTYDDRRRIITWIDSNRSRYDYVYDEQDRVIGEGGEAGHYQLTIAYGLPDSATGHRTTALTTADGHTTRHLIDTNCRVLATTDPLGHTTRFTYDGRGRALTRTDPLGRTTAFRYDTDGRLATVVRADGGELTTTRNALGLPVTLLGPDGARWAQEYDDRGNRTALTDPAGHTTSYGYDPHGRLTSVTDALGAVSTVRCDAAGLLLEVTDPLGGTTRIERDPFGRPIRATDALGAITTLRWTVDGQLSHRTSPDGTSESWTYDGEGNRTSHTDPLGQTTRFEHTHFDVMSARVDPDGVRYEFQHDRELRLTQVTNPQGLNWSYTYDPAGRLTSETDFDGRTLTYSLDPAGQLAARTTPLGARVAYEHDSVGQVIRKDAAGEVTEYTHDRAGRLLRASSPDGELVFQYDRRGLAKTEQFNGLATTYTYDALGRRTRRTTPSGRATTYDYDPAGRPTLLTSGDHRITFTHDAAGRELERTFGDMLRTASTWDEAGRLATEISTAGERVLNRRAYAYRADGYLTSLDDDLRGTQRFDLDPAGRVTSVTAANWTETYAYDEAGNQTAASWPTTHPGQEATGPRAYAGTNLTRAGNVRYEHDSAGRITLRQKTRLSRRPDTWRYTWNAEDRLTAVTTPDGTRWRYRYDPLGRRTAKQRLAPDGDSVVEETRFSWDGTTLAEQITTSNDLPHPVALTWDHQGRRPLAQTERILTADASQDTIDERFFAITTDLVGTPSELIDESGTIAWYSRATLWGTTTWNRDATTYTPLRFPGQYHDPETGLHYNYFRHYDPETARYLTPDPLGLTPAPNPTTYPHNPHTWTDPLGLSPCPAEQDRRPQPPSHGEGKGEAWAKSVTQTGRSDNSQVISGHGYYQFGSGDMVVPSGTWLKFYVEDGARLGDRFAHDIETGGNHPPVETFGPGKSLPNYTVDVPKNLAISSKSITVDSPTFLSEIVRDGMGAVHVLICREHVRPR